MALRPGEAATVGGQEVTYVRRGRGVRLEEAPARGGARRTGSRATARRPAAQQRVRIPKGPERRIQVWSPDVRGSGGRCPAAESRGQRDVAVPDGEAEHGVRVGVRRWPRWRRRGAGTRRRSGSGLRSLGLELFLHGGDGGNEDGYAVVGRRRRDTRDGVGNEALCLPRSTAAALAGFRRFRSELGRRSGDGWRSRNWWSRSEMAPGLW